MERFQKYVDDNLSSIRQVMKNNFMSIVTLATDDGLVDSEGNTEINQRHDFPDEDHRTWFKPSFWFIPITRD